MDARFISRHHDINEVPAWIGTPDVFSGNGWCVSHAGHAGDFGARETSFISSHFHRVL